ncbi:MAG TPA: ribose-5-phosphate isomerase RpiA [Terriglobales bacterium]|nr:ribose-5-phosphate isomerase RpiA [Terriglobales bacterium]
MRHNDMDMDKDLEKQAVARAALSFVENGQVVGLGSGSTSTYFIQFLADRVKAGLKIRGVPTSVRTQQLAEKCGIPLATLDQVEALDIDVDGADEFDPQLQLVKGGGGALLREKIIASASKKFVVLADSSKQVPILGKFPLPVEVIPFAETLLTQRISALGATVTLRKTMDGTAYKTDEGHHILDCHFGRIPDPAKLARTLSDMPGIVEHGLFINMASVVLLAKGEQVTELRR